MALERSGEVKRIHGGAMAPVRVTATEPNRANRTVEHQAEKREIAEIVASLVSDTDAIFFDVGTTVEAAANALPASYRGMVITNSLVVGSILGVRDGIELHMLGGRVRAGELTTYGPEVLAQIHSYNADWAFIGAGGVDAQAGLTDYSSEDIATKRLMIEKSARAYALGVHEKLGRVAVRHVCNLDALTGIITDSAADDTYVAAFRELGMEVLRNERDVRPAGQ